MEKIQVGTAMRRYSAEYAPRGFWALSDSLGRAAWLPTVELLTIADREEGRARALEFGCKVGSTSSVRRVVAAALLRWRDRVEMSEVAGGSAAYDALIEWLSAGLPRGWSQQQDRYALLQGMVDQAQTRYARSQRDNPDSMGSRLAWLAQDAANTLVIDHSCMPTTSALYHYHSVLSGFARAAESLDPHAPTALRAVEMAKGVEYLSISRRCDVERYRDPWTPASQEIMDARAAEVAAAAEVKAAWEKYYAVRDAAELRRQELDSQFTDMMMVFGD